MHKESFQTDGTFDDKKVKTRVILETPFSKEIQIIMSRGQIMKEHQAPYPIIIHILNGAIELGVNQVRHKLEHGDIITLDARVPHDLTALENTTIRLSLFKKDQAHRLSPGSETLKQDS